jgi:uncharacterized RDD family membrane protein YckC
MATPSGPRASFFRRLGAALLDGLLIGVVERILQAILGRDIGAALALAVGIAYFAYFEGGPSGQTVGKRALGIRVIDFSSSGPIGFSRGVLRYFARWLSAIVFFLGYFWMLWDSEKQTWHDKIAGAVVVPVSAYPVASWPGGGGQPVRAATDAATPPPMSPESATEPRSETHDEEQLRKFNEREKQWGGDA